MLVNKCPFVFVFMTALLSTLQVDGQVTQQKLRQFTDKAVQGNWFDFEPPCFDWQCNPMRYGLCYVTTSRSLEPVSYSHDNVATHNQQESPYNWTLQEQFVVTLIRSYRNKPTQQRFWVPILQRVEIEIAGMLNDIQNPIHAGQQLDEILQARSKKISNIYHQELDALARRYGYAGAELMSFCELTRWHGVPLSTDPKGGQIYYMPQGQWELYKFMQANGRPDYPKPQWTQIAQPESVSLMGLNIFYVKWPTLGGLLYNNVRISSDAPITFTPTGIR